MYSPQRNFNPRRDITGLLSWWDPVTAPQILNGPDNASGYSRVVDPVSGNDMLPNTGVTYEYVPTPHPTLGLNILNGSFSTSSDMKAVNFYTGLGLTGATIIAAFKKTTGADTNRIWRMGASGQECHHTYSGNTLYDDFFSATRSSFASASTTGEHIMACRSSTGLWTHHLDGTQQYSNTTNTFATPTSIRFFNGGSAIWLYEVILVGRFVTDTELASITRYMANRWGIVSL